jgi:lipopolysaccharide/colanic/teichoic acid biosynthesis glycosyltransferase
MLEAYAQNIVPAYSGEIVPRTEAAPKLHEPATASDASVSALKSSPSWEPVQRQIEEIQLEDSRTLLQDFIERGIALGCLILASPILLLLAICIRLDSPGSPIFRHYRVGKNGKLFRFYKFRTLYADAKQRFPERYSYKYTPDDLDALRFKVENDPRVTRAGRFLRRTTLDELPNFWNVVKGDMALVGPRPEIPEMLQYYRPDYLIKFCVKPGVTGLAQISGRGRLLFRATEELDARSVVERSPLTDVKIMFRTIYLIFKMDGAF